jgi:hypothetical protein
VSGIGESAAEFTQARGTTLYSEIHKHVNPVWNKEEFSQKWKVFIILLVFTEGDKTDCSK